MALPPGFRFHPTDEELVAYYLKKKVKGCSIEFDVVADVDLYKCEPWDLPSKSLLPGSDLEWFFFSPRDRKYPNGSRTNRATEAGYWKATGRDRTIKTSTGASKIIGMKKTLVFYTGRAPHGGRTDWLMHEYRLDGEEWDATSVSQDGYVLCRVFKKTAFVAKDPGGRPADEEVEIDGDPIVFDVDVKPSLELPAPTTPPRSTVDHAQDAAPLEQKQEIQNFLAEEGDLLCDVLQNYDETSFPKPDGNFWDCLLDDRYSAGPVVPDFGPSTCGTGIAQETIAQEAMKTWQPEHVPRLDVAALGLDSLWNDVDPAELSLLPSFNTLPVGADVFDEELDIMPPLVPSPSISDDSDLIDPRNLTLRQRPLSPWEPPASAFPSNMTASHRVLFQPRRVDRGRDKGGTTEVQKPPVAAHDPEVKSENNTVSEGTAAAKAADGGRSGDAVDSPITIMPVQTESPVNAARLDERSPALPHPTNELPCSALDNKVSPLSGSNSASIKSTPSSSKIVSDSTLESDLGPEPGSELTKSVNQVIESPHDPSHLPPPLPTLKPTLIMTKPSAVDPATQGPIRSVLLSVSDPLSNVKPSNREYKSGLDTIHVRTVTITCHEGDPPQMRATVCDSYRPSTYGHVPAERKIQDAKESEKRDSRILGWAFLVGTISASLAMMLCIEIGRGPAESFQPKRVLGHAGCK